MQMHAYNIMVLRLWFDTVMIHSLERLWKSSASHSLLFKVLIKL